MALFLPANPISWKSTKRKMRKLGERWRGVMLDPQTRNADLAMSFGMHLFGTERRPDLIESNAIVAEEMQRAMKGEMSLASRTFTAQALSLDAMFTELARRSAINMGTHPIASERYMKLALKAQGACRSTLEALAKLHQPREQTVRHVHVNEGGQAVIADQFHHHTGGQENGKTTEQPHVPDGSAAGASAALSGPDPPGDGVPISSREGEGAMQDARGQRKRGT